MNTQTKEISVINYRYIPLNRIQKSFLIVQAELEEVGLIQGDKYLWNIDVVQSTLPSFGELGFVYDDGLPWLSKILGFEEGVIYIPLYASIDSYSPGGTLTDVIRHEFAHAWARYDRTLFNKPWFKNTFGMSYWKEWPYGKNRFNEFIDEADFKNSKYFYSHVSAYALSSPAEDFAETFMTFLRYRKSLSRFRNRPELHRKLKSISNIIKITARTI